MIDKLTPERRSANMSRIRAKDTKPEMIVRRLVSSLGHRYRLHRKGLPGKPDLACGPTKKAVFVHGCFWHQHTGCREGRLPGTRIEYWKPKLFRNVERDTENIEALKKSGWKTLIIWECETTDIERLRKTVTRFLKQPAAKKRGT